MARQLRIEFPGALYHVTSRGDGREPIYLSVNDRKAFLSILGNTYERFHWQCYSYCLMSNHYHLFIETPLANLSKGMHYLNGVYTQKFNRVHSHVGHVFQGRFKAILVGKDSYLLALARYIVLNPVRAKMVYHASDWKWSSYLATCGEAKAPEWLASIPILSQFSISRSQAIMKYKKFIDEATYKNPWDDLKNQLYLGSDKFANQMIKHIDCEQDFINISKPQYTPTTKITSLIEYEQSSDNRNKAIRLAYESGNYTLKEIGSFFGLHYSRVSKIVNENLTN